ncbi:S-adenosyl-L-methionine-dependent methyltransferase [Exophiala viscosa]|uniref:S-adenosyl-L-methionine-dependent methyltransferase n=1 Tax=Exophiala viscosa TaxID=2486360 RepID=A0AAN6IA57_9EURO|nr:S-adenosyl-L-methionine-dependent methyltransferase [Exophiala viscosa]
MSWPPLKDRLLSLLVPGFILWPSVKSFVITAFQFYILQAHIPSASNFQQVRDDAFSKFWAKLNAPVDPPPPPVGSMTLVPPILSRAHGVVLDIGPGSGTHVGDFSDNPNITTIFGAEPMSGLHPNLQQSINEAKLSGKYHILGCTAEKKDLLAALKKEGVRATTEIFDTIVCVRVLCSVPNVDETVREFYSLLKPGGQLMVVEHIRNPWKKNGSVLGRLAQLFWSAWGWTFFMAACELNRDTTSSLKRAGAWEAVELKTHFEWAALPYVSGTLTKVR